MNKDKLLLIYVNNVGTDYRGKHVYEFIFSDSLEGVDGEGWDEFPALGKPEPPFDRYIKSVGRIISDYKFDVIQDSDSFCVWDALDGLISLAWEDISHYDDYPDTRMHFKYGDTKENIEDILYNAEITIEYIL